MNAAQRARDLLDLIVDECNGMDNIGRRIVANRIVATLVAWLPEEKKSAVAEIVEPFTDEEAKRYGAEVMAFGKHAGERIDAVDLDYLVWLADASRATFRGLHRYLNSPRLKAERAEEEC